MRVLALSLFALALSGVAFAHSVLTPVGFVNDFANVMTEPAKASLEATLVQFNASTTNEVSVVTVSSLEGDYIENYAVHLFEEWGIGTEEKDNGVLLLLAIEDRAMRIEVGYGLEGALPDSVADSILRDMTPLLQSANYDGAITLGASSIIDATEGEYVGTSSSPSGIDSDFIFGLIAFAVFLIQWLASMFARSKSFWAGGVVGGIIGVAVSSLFGWWLVLGLGITTALALIGLLLDYAVSSAYQSAKRSGSAIPWFAGGGSSSGGGGFGGFGGGMSGGGGATGRW